jgi:tetratricopeptide (TPR) repeat protein
MGRIFRTARWTLGLVLLGAALGAAGVWRHWPGSPLGSLPEERFPLPPLPPAPFLNTGPQAHYLGITACKECHPANHRSYLLTPHSRALGTIDPKTEPPDGTFQHEPSGHSFRVYRQGEQVRHEEVLRSQEGREIARMDLPIRYLVGSGHFTRSYLVEVDGFLHESPITWYASRNRWDLSPGYDFPSNYSFERPITLGCLACHAGRVQPEDGALHRLKILEQAIGCENCHGPGSLHADFHRAGQRLLGKDDPTIVNPGKLSRSDLEAVCAVCHLSGVATTYLRGRNITDFRPGLPLSAFRIDYCFDHGNEQMTVVGHLQQLQRSACYQKSADLTCLTCHDPHAANQPKNSVAFYRQKCLNCHSTQSCSLEPGRRLAQEPADNCAACHMPRGKTDIPHIAFTHHRIGRHAPEPPADSDGVPELMPINEVSNLSPLDQKRQLGLAYLALLDSYDTTPLQAPIFKARARTLLGAVEKAKMQDGVSLVGLARLDWQERNYAGANARVQQALEGKDLTADARADGLLILANCCVHEHNYAPAIEALEKVTKLRRYSGDWRLLGMCYLEQNQLPQALAALQQALVIRPWRPDVHLGLAMVYRRLGDADRANDHTAKAQWLTAKEQK